MSDLLPAASSSAFLAADSPLRRLLRAPGRQRAPAFLARFEARALVYDAFWHADGARILLVGPAPLNLAPAWRRARLIALPSNTPLRARLHATLSVLIVELWGAPAGTTHVTLEIAGEAFQLPLQPNLAKPLAGSRVLFSMNKDNDLAWIAEWAGFHARRHGTDAVILFDNGSTRYTPAEIAARLLAVPGLRHVVVPSWPWAFGSADPAVRANPFWAHFLQNASMSVVLRRYAASAFGLLNCDIDELAMTRSGRSIYELAAASRGGLIGFVGEWVEGVAEPQAPQTALTHRHFQTQSADPAARLSDARKWALDPSRAWLRRLNVHPYWHWLANRPPFAKSMPDDAYYLHFKGINTGWKDDRSAPPPGSALPWRNPALSALFPS